MSNLLLLDKHTLQDIGAVLRSIADAIDEGEYGKIHMGALVLEDEVGNVRTFGMGGADYYRAMAMFQFGIANLIAKRGEEYML
jgi:hypothetical protein